MPVLLVISLGNQTDGIFVEMFTNFADIETVIGLFADGNNSCLNFEITGKFPGNQHCHTRRMGTREQLGHLRPSRYSVLSNLFL